MTNANLSLEAQFHAGQIDTDTAIALLAHSPAVQAALRQFWPEDVTPKMATDDKLGHRKMFEVELGDAMIRELDVGGGRGFDLFAALFEKLAYNQCRSDHKREARLAPNGKKC